jgi:hypothetical protein
MFATPTWQQLGKRNRERENRVQQGEGRLEVRKEGRHMVVRKEWRQESMRQERIVVV